MLDVHMPHPVGDGADHSLFTYGAELQLLFPRVVKHLLCKLPAGTILASCKKTDHQVHKLRSHRGMYPVIFCVRLSWFLAA